MELRQLRYFVAVAEEGNISRAAQKIFLTQPALSRQIKALEEDLGQPLLERQAHSIRLTGAGEILLHEARDLLSRADQLVERIRLTGGGPRLRVGYAPSLAAGMLATAVGSFTQLHPTARVELFDLSTAEMLAGLESGRLEVVVTVGNTTGSRGVQWVPLVRDPWQLAVPRRHPLAAQERVEAAALAGQPLLMFCRKDYPEYWDAVTGWFQHQGQRPRVAGEYDGAESLVSAVESGLGVALVTRRMSRLYPDRVPWKALTDPPPPLCIAAGVRPDRLGEQPLAVFLEELKAAAAPVAAETAGIAGESTPPRSASGRQSRSPVQRRSVKS